MPFHIQPLREFLVRPSLPESLVCLTELAQNILWSWEPIVRSMFRRLDPALWRECGYNPVLMLGRMFMFALLLDRPAFVDKRWAGTLPN